MARESDFVLWIGSNDGKTTVKTYAQGYLWEHDDSWEKTDQQKSDFHAVNHVYPSYWDKVAIKGNVATLNIAAGDPRFRIDGEDATLEEVLNHGSGKPGSSTDSPEDASGTFDGGAAIDAGDFDADAKHGVVPRAVQSHRDNPLTVGAGGDVGTIQDGVNQWPLSVGHVVDLQLEPGTHSNEPGNSVNMPAIDVASAHGSAKIVGDRDNPEDYVIDAKQLNFQLNGGSAQNVGLEGVTVKGTVQARRGSLEIDDCRLIAGDRWGKGDAGVPLDTYGPNVQVKSSYIEGDTAINFVEFANVSFSSGSEVNVDGPLASSGQGGGELAVSGNVDVSAPRLTDKNWDQSIVTFKDPHGATDGIAEGARADVRR